MLLHQSNLASRLILPQSLVLRTKMDSSTAVLSPKTAWNVPTQYPPGNEFNHAVRKNFTQQKLFYCAEMQKKYA